MSWSEQSFATRARARRPRPANARRPVLRVRRRRHRPDAACGRCAMPPARGVRVRLLLDDLYTGGNDPLLLGLAAHPNVEIRLFNPFMVRPESVGARVAASLFDFGRVNHRMHNKLFIADGAMAVAGGRNIGDEYFMAHRRRQLHRPRRVRGRRGAADAGGPVRPVLEQRARLSARGHRAGDASRPRSGGAASSRRRWRRAGRRCRGPERRTSLGQPGIAEELAHRPARPDLGEGTRPSPTRPTRSSTTRPGFSASP